LRVVRVVIMRDMTVIAIRIFDSFVRVQRRVVANHSTRSESVDLQKSEVLGTEKESLRNFPPEILLKKCITRWMPAKRLLPFANYMIHSAVVSRRTESWQRVK